MFDKKYEQVICKNVAECEYVNSVAIRLGKNPLPYSCYCNMVSPITMFLFGDNIGYHDRLDRIGEKHTFLDFVKWEQSQEADK